MTVARHDWVSANKLNPERSGPEIYAPTHRRTPEQLSNADHIPPLHPQTNEAGQADDRAGANLDPLIRHMTGTSIKEIDGLTVTCFTTICCWPRPDAGRAARSKAQLSAWLCQRAAGILYEPRNARC